MELGERLLGATRRQSFQHGSWAWYAFDPYWRSDWDWCYCSAQSCAQSLPIRGQSRRPTHHRLRFLLVWQSRLLRVQFPRIQSGQHGSIPGFAKVKPNLNRDLLARTESYVFRMRFHISATLLFDGGYSKHAGNNPGQQSPRMADLYTVAWQFKIDSGQPRVHVAGHA
jgi:hypothetical protein